MNHWNTTIGGLILRVIWLALFAAAVIAVLRLMAWADTGSKGECPIETSIIPTTTK